MNIQVIDSALNCTYDIFSTSDGDFRLIFPAEGQDIEFVEDFWTRVGEAEARRITEALWQSPVDKRKVAGIHGTLFYGLETKKKYYPTKRAIEMVRSYQSRG